MSYTLAQLRTQVREASDSENDGHKTDSEINTYINQGGQALHDLITAANEDYYLTSVQFTLSSVNTYTLPTTFYKLRGLDYDDGERWLKVSPYNFAERERYREEDYEGTYRLWYLLRYVPLASDADVLDDLWSEYVVLYAARKCLRKEESDVGDIDRDLANLTQRIVSMTAKRDAGGPRHVAEVRRIPGNDPLDDSSEYTTKAYRVMQNAIFVVSRGWALR